MPEPHEELLRLRMFGSPVDAHTTSGCDCETAMPPSATDDSCWNNGSHVVPALMVFQTPLEAVAAYTMRGVCSTTAKSTMRVPVPPGPTLRQDSPMGTSAETWNDVAEGNTGAASAPAKARTAITARVM